MPQPHQWAGFWLKMIFFTGFFSLLYFGVNFPLLLIVPWAGVCVYRAHYKVYNPPKWFWYWRH